MSRETLRAIQCPACGAGLDVLGGGRVAVLVCPYCTTELDAVQNFAALRKFDGLKRPNTPFRLGMEGEIAGIRHQIIGILGQVERWKGREWHWAEHLLYSETHGYSWLSLEDGHCLWSRRIRWSLPEQLFRPSYVNQQEHRPHFRAEGRTWHYLESTSQTADYVEGSFTWVPKLGDLTTSLSYLADGEILTVEAGASETEQTLTRWLPRAEVAKTFGIAESNLPRPQGRHPAEPLPQGDDRFALTTAGSCAAALLLLIGGLNAQTHVLLPGQPFPLSTLPRTIDLPVTQANRLMGIHLDSNVENGWHGFDLELEDPEGNLVFEREAGTSYYHGREDGEYWTEGDRSAHVTLRPAEAGTYRLTVANGGSEMEPGEAGQPATEVTLRVVEGEYSLSWILLGLVGLLGLGAAGPLRRWIARKDRLRHGDWDEE